MNVLFGRSSACVCLIALTSLLVRPSQVLSQDAGFLTGVVLDDASGDPLEGATVRVPAHGLEARTGENGGFLLEDVPPGGLQVRFEADGYVSVVEDVQLSSADFLQVRLSRVEAVLDEILVLAGRAPRSAAAGDVEVREGEEDLRSVMDLLEDQVPGVIVSRSGSLGTGATLQLRGVGSFQTDNRPAVYLDGVRISGESAAPTLRHLAGGDVHGIHVLELIPASTVQRVRVLRGAAAATAYPFAANGVILIETNRGGSPTER